MSRVLQFRYGNSAQVSAFTGAPREIVVDAAVWRLVLQDGVTIGGVPVAKQSNEIAIGIGTAADPANPLSVTANNTVFSALSTGSGGTGDHRIRLNKQSSTNTISCLFQDAFSTCAEIGLVGDDNLHFRVSPDGSTFYEAMVITGASGAVSFLTTPSAPTAVAGTTTNQLATTAFAASVASTAANAALNSANNFSTAIGLAANNTSLLNALIFG